MDNKTLMQSVIDPSAHIVWDSVQTIMTKERTEEIRPRTEAEWKTVRNGALTLAEAGNLLMIVPRARDSGEWMKAAQQLIDIGTEALKAAEAKDADRLFIVGGDIREACSACHRRYMEAIVNAHRE